MNEAETRAEHIDPALEAAGVVVSKSPAGLVEAVAEAIMRKAR